MSSRQQRPLRPGTTCQGFTLLEMLAAIAIFALVSLMAYGGLETILKSQQLTEERAARLTQLQGALLLLGREVSQVVERGIRDEFGDSHPALRGDADGGQLELTHSGWPNPAEQPRSTLQRVAYRLDGDTLVRRSWQVLDRAQDSVPYQATLLKGVKELRLRFLDPARQWQDSWPPLTPPQQDKPPPAIPLALELTVTLEDWGEITRLFRLPGGGS